jgi:HK97 family phage prohead protease
MPISDAAVWKASSDAGEVEGYLSVFDVADREDDVVERGAFDGVIKAWNLSGQRLPLVVDHDETAVVGEVVELEEDSVGVKFRARFDASPQSQDVRRRALLGDVRGVSYSYTARRRPGWVRGKAVQFITAIKALSEVTLSLLSRPVNPLAQLTAAKAGAGWPAMPVRPGQPAAHEVVTQDQWIAAERWRRSPERQALAHKARQLEGAWPGPEIVGLVGVEAAWNMMMSARARVESDPQVIAARDAAAKAEMEARREAEFQRSWATIVERNSRPCGYCPGCRHGYRCSYG